MDENSTANYFDDYENYTGNCCNTPVEICEPDNSRQLTIMVVQVTVFLIAFILGVIGNSLVIATFAKYRRLRLRCMTDVFLFYLAISDLLLLLTLPLETTQTIQGSWPLENWTCKLNYGLCAINTYGGLLFLACISIDRYMLVVWARTAQALRPSMLYYSNLSAIAVAVTSFVLSLPELQLTAVHPDSSRCEYVGIDGDKWKIKTLARVAKIIGFCVPCVTMLVCYTTIGHVLMQGRGKCFRRQKTLRLIVALIVLFLLFQLPYAIVLSIRMFISNYSCQLWEDIHLAEDVTRSLAYIRCCLNPLLYALVGVRFRNDVIRLLRDCSCIRACLSRIMPKLEYGSLATLSSPAPTSTPMPYDVNAPKTFPDADPNLASVPRYGVNAFSASQKPAGIVISVSYSCQ